MKGAVKKVATFFISKPSFFNVGSGERITTWKQQQAFPGQSLASYDSL